MSTIPMTINGREVMAASSFDVIDPATGRAFASAPQADRAQLEEAMAAAQRAFSSWRRVEPAERQRIVAACADALLAAREPLARLLTQEQGKPIRAARHEVDETARWFRHYAGADLSDRVVQDDAGVLARVQRQPLGVVAAITPWNFPLLLAAMKLAPALVTGNVVVLKPSPFTPLATLEMGRLLARVLPAGVLNVVTGGNDLGAWMSVHPVVRKISFTGSVATGMAVAANAAADLKRVTLELGGNDAAIVLDDADPARIARGLLWGAFTNAGQICAGIKRVFVPETLHDAVAAALVETARGIRVGAGLDEAAQMGPVATRPQFERVGTLIAEALGDGAKALCGGVPEDRPGGGYFVRPTILSDTREGMRVVDEEQFGPVLPLLRYRDVDEALARANSGNFGLSASVWSGSEARARVVAAELDCGSTYVNTHLVIKPELPFGGVRWSGIGVENGEWVLDEYTHPKVLYVERTR